MTSENRTERKDVNRPRNEPTEPKEVRGGGQRTPTSGPNYGSTQSGQQSQTVNRSSTEKIGQPATPRTGTTTGGSSNRATQETRGSPRNAGDESSFPKRSGPNTKDR